MWRLLLLPLLCCAKSAAPPVCAPTALALERTGPDAQGIVRLPNGRGVQPAGQVARVGASPMGLALSADGAQLAVARFGVDDRGLALATPGLAVTPLWRGNAGGYYRVAFAADGSLYALNTGAKTLEHWAQGVRASVPLDCDWPTDFTLTGNRVLLACGSSGQVEAVSADTGARQLIAQAGGRYPASVALDGQGSLFVAYEGSSHVLQLDATTLDAIASYPVHKNPAALLVQNGVVYVAASDADAIDRIDVNARALLAPISLAPPGAGLSVSPDALAADANHLYVAAGLLNAIVVVDLASGAQLGAIPAGQRPEAVATSNGALYVANGGDGTLQRIAPVPEGAALADATAAVARLNALPAQEAANCGDGLAPIRHLIVVLKENKTFDSVFGDFAGADADPKYLQWGEHVTPNQHELAREFCLLDNFFVESSQSLEGHFWAAAGITNDYLERTWPASWGANVTAAPLPASGLGEIDTPPLGFLFDGLARARVGYTSYGEFVGVGGDLAHHLQLDFVDTPASFLARPDTEKLRVFIDDLNKGRLQPLTFLDLQYDHTSLGAPRRRLARARLVSLVDGDDRARAEAAAALGARRGGAAALGLPRAHERRDAVSRHSLQCSAAAQSVAPRRAAARFQRPRSGARPRARAVGSGPAGRAGARADRGGGRR